MTFEINEIPIGDAIEQTPEYIVAQEKRGGLPLGSRVIDKKRNIVLYCSNVGRNLDRPPGEYFLFINGDLKVLSVHLYYTVTKNRKTIANYRIYTNNNLDSFLVKHQATRELLNEAFKTMGRSYPTIPDNVIIEFKKENSQYGNGNS